MTRYPGGLAAVQPPGEVDPEQRVRLGALRRPHGRRALAVPAGLEAGGAGQDGQVRLVEVVALGLGVLEVIGQGQVHRHADALVRGLDVVATDGRDGQVGTRGGDRCRCRGSERGDREAERCDERQRQGRGDRARGAPRHAGTTVSVGETSTGPAQGASRSGSAGRRCARSARRRRAAGRSPTASPSTRRAAGRRDRRSARGPGPGRRHPPRRPRRSDRSTARPGRSSSPTLNLANGNSSFQRSSRRYDLRK